jgi:hypothetical protein
MLAKSSFLNYHVAVFALDRTYLTIATTILQSSNPTCFIILDLTHIRRPTSTVHIAVNVPQIAKICGPRLISGSPVPAGASVALDIRFYVCSETSFRGVEVEYV